MAGSLATKLRRLLRPTVIGMAVVWFAYMGAAAFVILVDPYDLYPWGIQVKAARRYDAVNAAKMIRIAAKDRDSDTVLIGTSPTALVTPEDMQAVFPDAHAPWNLSYLFGAPDDRLAVLREIRRHSRARHVIVTLDFFLVLPTGRTSLVFPGNFYDDDYTNDLRVVDTTTLRETLTALRRGTPFPDVAAATAEMGISFIRVSGVFRDPYSLNSIAAAIPKYRAVIDASGAETCATFPMLAPFEDEVRRMAAQGRKVDLLLPAFSPSAYYRWRSDYHRPSNDQALAEQHRQLGDHAFANQLLMRKCIAKALDGAANVAISAADLDFDLTRSLANYYDPTHLKGHDKLRRMLAAMRDPRFRITAANVDAYVEALRRTVKDYCPRGFPDRC